MRGPLGRRPVLGELNHRKRLVSFLDVGPQPEQVYPI